MSLIVDSITKRFGEVLALDKASFTVEPGRIFGCWARTAPARRRDADRARHPRADDGHVTWMGREHGATAPHVGLPPEERGLYPKMRVGEQLRSSRPSTA